jgi:tetratricopeptide (TPR) repeat protein
MPSRALEELIKYRIKHGGEVMRAEVLQRRIKCQSLPALKQTIYKFRKETEDFLSKKLNIDQLIETVPSEGYRINGDVEELSSEKLEIAVHVLDKSELKIGLNFLNEFPVGKYTFTTLPTQSEGWWETTHESEADYVLALEYWRDSEFIQARVNLQAMSDGSLTPFPAFKEPIKEDDYDSFNKLSRRIANSVHLKLQERDRQPRRPISSGAIREYKVAIALMEEHPRPGSLRSAEEHFRKALSSEEGYFAAKVGLALNLIWQALFGLIEPAKAFDEARMLAQEAQDNSEEMAGAYCALGFIELFERNFPGAEDSFNKSLNYDSDYSLAYEGCAMLQTAQANFKEALKWIEKAIESNPKRFFCYAIRGIIYYEWGKDREAIQALEECKELEPYFDAVFFGLALVHIRMEDCEKAMEYAEVSLKLSDFSTLNQALVAYIHAVCGSLMKAKETADKLREEYESNYVSPYYLSILYAQLGESETARGWMEKAEQVKDPWRLVRPFDFRSKDVS